MGRVISILASAIVDVEILPINVPSTIRRLDHSRTYTLDDIVATSLLREVATKREKRKNVGKKVDL